MSQENVDRVRTSFEAYIVGDYAVATLHLAPDVVWENGQELPARGRSAVQEMWRRWDDEWAELETVAEEFIDAGDRVVLGVRYRGVGRASGIEVTDQVFEVHTFRDGRCVRKADFGTRPEALAAAGLSE